MRCKVASWRETVMWGLVYIICGGIWVPSERVGTGWSGCGQEMAGGGVGAVVEALGIFLDLLDGFTVGREAGVGVMEEEKVIVPFTEGFLGGFVAGGEGGDGFGGVDACLCEVACDLGGFAESVEVL